MTVIAIRAPGGPEMLVPVERPVPQPSQGEILVAVAAAGVNRPDVMQRKGLYPPPKGVTDIPGLEIAGTVAACGAGVQRWKVAIRSARWSAAAAMRNIASPRNPRLASSAGPDAMAQAGAIPETFFTVWHNAFERGGLKSGETLLVHGGSSGIGTTAIQLAKAFGAKVITTAGTPEKCDACRRLGADVAVNYKSEDFVAAAKAATGGAGVEVILDMVGGDYVERNYEAAAVEGRVVQIASQGSPRASVDFRRLMLKRLHHTGSTLRSRGGHRKGGDRRSRRAPCLASAFDWKSAASHRQHLSIA